MRLQHSFRNSVSIGCKLTASLVIKNPARTFKTMPNAKSFLWKMSFICIRIKIDFFLSTSTSRNLFLNRGVEQLKSGLLPWWGTYRSFIRVGSASRSNPLPIYRPFWDGKGTLLSTFYWQMVPLPNTYFRTVYSFKCCKPHPLINTNT